MTPVSSPSKMKWQPTATRAATLIVPAVLIIAVLATNFWAEGNGSFETVVSRLVPWSSTVAHFRSAELSTPPSTPLPTTRQVSKTQAGKPGQAIDTSSVTTSIFLRDEQVMLPINPEDEMLSPIDTAPVLTSAPAERHVSADTTRKATVVPDTHSIKLEEPTLSFDTRPSTALRQDGTKGLVALDSVNSDRIFEPTGSWEPNANGQGYSFVGSSNTDVGRKSVVAFNATMAHELLGGKWIYFWGDSTMRQIFTAFLNGIQGSSITFQEAKSAFRSSGAQPNRKPYKPLPFDDTPCFVNEHVEQEDLAIDGSGSSISLTYGWKHFIHEEYDVTFLRDVLPAAKPGKLPDVIVLSTGLHNCWHFGDSLEWENQREFDEFLAELDRTGNPLPPIVWLDNVLFVNGPPNSGWPDVCRRFNGYFRERVKERIRITGRREALVSRENMTWETPRELWGDEWRLHLAGDVYVAVGELVLRAMKALGV